MTESENFQLDWVVDVTNLPRSGASSKFDADDRECAALAKFLEIVSICNFSVKVKIEGRKKRRVSVAGHLRAVITQSCVVTLLPVETIIDVKFDRLLVASEKVLEPSPKVSEQREVDFDLADDDPPDTFDGRQVDIGQIALEELALQLEAYPRHSSADEWASTDEQESNLRTKSGSKPVRTTEKASPFAALRKLKPDQNPEE